MARTILFFLIEFWDIIVGSIIFLIPAIVVGLWFFIRKYLIAQNFWIAQYKPTIDVIFAIIGVLIALNWLDEFKKDVVIKRNIKPLEGSKIYFVCPANDLHIRKCAKPLENECPSLAIIPRETLVVPTGEKSEYLEDNIPPRSWMEIKYKDFTGWVNSNYICSK